jgi:VWFA-related protein
VEILMRRPLGSRRAGLAFSLAVAIVAGDAMLSAQDQPSPGAVFRTLTEIISIDVVVRDRAGMIVRDLAPSDFEVREDGRPQEILTTSFQQAEDVSEPAGATPILQNLGAMPPSSRATTEPPAELNGRRLIMLLFDLSSMEPEEVDRGVKAALEYVDTRMSNADLVAVASLTWELRLLTDFSGDRAAVKEVLENLVAVDTSTGTSSPDLNADLLPADPARLSTVAATDARLRALRLIAEALTPIAQKKALLYFTGGLANAAQDTPAELRAATSAASRANLAIYPVDTRGLQTIIPNGAAESGSRSGTGVFDGGDVNDQFNDLTASQDTMMSMASATGGRVFSGANDVSAAFTRVLRDTAAYYLLGYSSANLTRDGRFRRVQVRVRREGLRVEARAGYYVDRDFAHMGRADREAQLEESLSRPLEPSLLDLETVVAEPALRGDSFLVPVTITARSPNTNSPAGDSPLDILAVVEDEQGRPIARLRDTVDGRRGALQRDGLSYTSNLLLPRGRFTLNAVVRENVDGTVSRRQTAIVVPDSDEVFEIVATSSPTTRPGEVTPIEAVIWDGLSGVDPARPLTVTATYFRDSARVAEVILLEATPAPATGAVRRFMLAGLPEALPPGRYVYQVTAVDPLTRRFAVARTVFDSP